MIKLCHTHLRGETIIMSTIALLRQRRGPETRSPLQCTLDKPLIKTLLDEIAQQIAHRVFGSSSDSNSLRGYLGSHTGTISLPRSDKRRRELVFRLSPLINDCPQNFSREILSSDADISFEILMISFRAYYLEAICAHHSAIIRFLPKEDEKRRLLEASLEDLKAFLNSEEGDLLQSSLEEMFIQSRELAAATAAGEEANLSIIESGEFIPPFGFRIEPASRGKIARQIIQNLSRSTAPERLKRVGLYMLSITLGSSKAYLLDINVTPFKEGKGSTHKPFTISEECSSLKLRKTSSLADFRVGLERKEPRTISFGAPSSSFGDTFICEYARFSRRFMPLSGVAGSTYCITQPYRALTRTFIPPREALHHRLGLSLLHDFLELKNSTVPRAALINCKQVPTLYSEKIASMTVEERLSILSPLVLAEEHFVDFEPIHSSLAITRRRISSSVEGMPRASKAFFLDIAILAIAAGWLDFKFTKLGKENRILLSSKAFAPLESYDDSLRKNSLFRFLATNNAKYGVLPAALKQHILSINPAHIALALRNSKLSQEASFATAQRIIDMQRYILSMSETSVVITTLDLYKAVFR